MIHTPENQKISHIHINQKAFTHFFKNIPKDTAEQGAVNHIHKSDYIRPKALYIRVNPSVSEKSSNCIGK